MESAIRTRSNRREGKFERGGRPCSPGDALAAVRRALEAAQVEYGRLERTERAENAELRAARRELEEAQQYIAWLAEQLRT